MENPVCKEVIITYNEPRGDGTTINPCRVVTKVFEKDGTFIAEWDNWKQKQGHPPKNNEEAFAELGRIFKGLEKHFTDQRTAETARAQIAGWFNKYTP